MKRILLAVVIIALLEVSASAQSIDPRTGFFRPNQYGYPGYSGGYSNYGYATYPVYPMRSQSFYSGGYGYGYQVTPWGVTRYTEIHMGHPYPVRHR